MAIKVAARATIDSLMSRVLYVITTNSISFNRLNKNRTIFFCACVASERKSAIDTSVHHEKKVDDGMKNVYKKNVVNCHQNK